MFKIILSLILIAACGGAGILKAQSFSQRTQDLRDMQDMLRIMRTDISYMKDPLPVIFERLGSSRNNAAAEILKTCHLLMQENQDMQYSWYTAVDMAARNSSFTKEDKTILYEVGLHMGRSNVQGQLDVLDMIDEKLERQIAGAEKERASKGKMYAGLGFSAGIIMAILLL